jgi:biotin carboxyl carrier protein
LQFETEIGGRLRTLVVKDQGGGFAVTVDGRTCRVDAARIGADMLSLVIYDMLPKGDTFEKPGASAGDRFTPSPTDVPGLDRRTGSYEVTLWRDRASGRLAVKIGLATIAVGLNGNRRRREDDGHARSGPQLVAAPMPGKIVRVLVKPGEVVRARQPLVVVEAMKMENELRATGDGTVTQIHVREGESVEAGAPVIAIE